ncbi:MAG TPA: hypothetical protein VEZ90_13970, partial [Blastocatellia bacterium]|nr:hypothetical protein [Blastocatellia bacterium]
MTRTEYLTARKFAKEVGRPYSTVLYWLKKGLVPGVEVVQETSGVVYRIPRSAVAQFKKQGPRRGR